jgi:hypothetical protein
MKNYKFYVLLPLIFLMASCQKDHDIEFVDLGSEFFISKSGYTSLDNQISFTIKNQQNNLAQVSVIEKFKDGTIIDLGAIPIADSVGKVTYTDAQIQITEIDTSATFIFEGQSNGIDFSRSTTVTVTDPIKVTAPDVIRVADPVYLYYSIKPATATVDNVMIEQKVGALATYQEVTGDFNPVDSVAIVGADYNLYDTLFIKVKGAAGSKVAETVTKIIIKPDMAEPHLFNLMMGDGYDLVNDTLVEAISASADIVFTGEYTTNGVKVGFDLTHAEFVPATNEEYVIADRMTIMSADFVNVITSADNLVGAETYYFRTRHEATDDYTYGMIKVRNVDKPQGVLADSSVEYEIKK